MDHLLPEFFEDQLPDHAGLDRQGCRRVIVPILQELPGIRRGFFVEHECEVAPIGRGLLKRVGDEKLEHREGNVRIGRARLRRAFEEAFDQLSLRRLKARLRAGAIAKRLELQRPILLRRNPHSLPPVGFFFEICAALSIAAFDQQLFDVEERAYFRGYAQPQQRFRGPDRLIFGIPQAACDDWLGPMQSLQAQIRLAYAAQHRL